MYVYMVYIIRAAVDSARRFVAGSNAIETQLLAGGEWRWRGGEGNYILNTRCLNGYSVEALTAAAAAAAAAAEAAAASHSVGSTSKPLQKNIIIIIIK